MIARLLLATSLLVPGTAFAQAMDPSMPMPGMGTSSTPNKAAKPAVKPSPHKHPKRTAAKSAATPRNGTAPAMSNMPEMPGMSMPMPGQGSGAGSPVGDAPPPPPPTDHYADRTFGTQAMSSARAEFQKENGGQTFSQIMINLAELQIGDNHPGYRWDGEGWFGGDLNRFVVKSEGNGSASHGLDEAEVQALYSRAVGPYFDLQAGVRQDIRPTPARTYATVGFEGLAPYWFQTEGALFLSNKGDLLGRLEGYYDQYITQRLVLQPRVELNFAAQDVPNDKIGSGLSDAELGLRLRYEIRREFAPYIGVSWDRKVGRTADYARAEGENPSSLNFVIGIRAWY